MECPHGSTCPKGIISFENFTTVFLQQATCKDVCIIRYAFNEHKKINIKHPNVTRQINGPILHGWVLEVWKEILGFERCKMGFGRMKKMKWVNKKLAKWWVVRNLKTRKEDWLFEFFNWDKTLEDPVHGLAQIHLI